MTKKKESISELNSIKRYIKDIETVNGIKK